VRKLPAFFLLLSLTAGSAWAAHTKAELVLEAESARPGDTILAGIHLRMDPGWHTYWRNPGTGGLGIATTIEWELPKGITAGSIQWPVPEKLIDKNPDTPNTTYIFKDDVVLLVPLKVGTDITPGTATLKAKVSWLECAVQCVLGDASVQAMINVGAETKPSKDAPLLEAWQKKMPRSGDGLPAKAWWEGAAKNDLRPMILEWNTPPPAKEADFYPDSSEQFEVQPITEKLPSEPGTVRLRAQVKKLSADWPQKIAGLLVQDSDKGQLAYDVSLPVGGGPSGPAQIVGSTLPETSLWKILLYAFIGGLILNVMPCVLPVIALKILGFVSDSRSEPGRVRKLGLIYAGGVLVSFLALAALVLGVKAAGHQAGWGMQFGNPQFVVALTVLVTLVALNLFGIFEVNPGGRITSAAGELASKRGSAGAFFNGVLATILATPCTAPFLSIALGFAFAQTALIVLLVFLTIGVGLAFPYVLLSWNPAWLKFLPKPGAWMEKFKIAMGFPMLATALWLMSLLQVHYGEQAWWVGIFLVFVGVAAWIYGQFVQRGSDRRWLAAVIAVIVLVLGYDLVLEHRVHWRSPQTGASAGMAENEPGGVPWKPWSPQAVAAARAEGRPVLVDFTARWCLTCNTLVKPALEDEAVRNKLKETGAVALLADYTRVPSSITQELNKYGRAGVPLVLAFPKNPNEPPIVLPEPSPLRPPSHYSGIVLGALEQAARQ
jgi:thiol:disulfide interchange protein